MNEAFTNVHVLALCEHMFSFLFFKKITVVFQCPIVHVKVRKTLSTPFP